MNSDYDTVVKVVFRDSVCSDPTEDLGLVLILGAAIGGLIVIVLIFLLIVCKVKKRFCF